MTRALALAALVAAGPAHAQWDWEAEVRAGVERASNVLRAPDVLLAEEAVLDSVLLDDTVLPLRATAEVERAWGGAEVSARYDGRYERYAGAGHLDGTRHELRARAEAERGALEARAEASWERTERVGVSVLGDVRPQLFRYTQPEAAARLRWTPARAHRLTLAGGLYRRDYAPREGALPLDHREAEAEAAWRVRRRVPGRTLWAVEATVGVRERVYRDLRARAADGDRADDHPANRLLTVDAAVDAERSLAPALTAAVEAGARRRRDPFEGFYTYTSAEARGELAWEPSDRVAVEVGVGYRRVRYDVQPAPQAEGEAPPLRYGYLRWDAEATLRPVAGVEVAAFLDGTSRRSNVTRETLLRRRSYRTAVAGLAVRLDLRRAASGRD